MPLAIIEPEGLNPIGNNEWEEIEVAVDSGATENVMSPGTLTSRPITSVPAFVRGVKYEVANGVQIPNLGERKFLGYMEDGAVRGITAQVCAVNKTLMSVIKIARAGHRVVFDDDGSCIEDKTTGERLWMAEIGGMYSIKLWVSRNTSTGF